MNDEKGKGSQNSKDAKPKKPLTCRLAKPKSPHESCLASGKEIWAPLLCYRSHLLNTLFFNPDLPRVKIDFLTQPTLSLPTPLFHLQILHKLFSDHPNDNNIKNIKTKIKN